MFNAFGHKFKDMTREELEAKVTKKQNLINAINDEILSYVTEYIEGLPYKVGDKVSCSSCDVSWIETITPEQYNSYYTGDIVIRINPAKKDGTRSNRLFVLFGMEIDNIKKIDLPSCKGYKIDSKMKKYIGTKVVNATPAWRVDGKVYLKDEAVPKSMNREDGYKVVYEGGYESWSPKDVFEKAYREVGSVNFGGAIDLLKAGLAVRRKGWNGKGLFIVKQVPSHITGDIIPNMQSLPQSAKIILMNRENPHIDYTNQMLIINPDGRADSWVPSVSDVFAEDWEVVTE